jgi:hypothetical protein
VATHIRPVLSTAIVAVSLPGSETVVGLGRADHGTYVCADASYWIETSRETAP